jgi:hypothetical protein
MLAIGYDPLGKRDISILATRAGNREETLDRSFRGIAPSAIEIAAHLILWI